MAQAPNATSIQKQVKQQVKSVDRGLNQQIYFSDREQVAVLRRGFDASPQRQLGLGFRTAKAQISLFLTGAQNLTYLHLSASTDPLHPSQKYRQQARDRVLHKHRMLHDPQAGPQHTRLSTGGFEDSA